LGVFLGTFGYALIVLRAVRGGEDDAFVPALGVTVGLVLAATCVALLIYFVHQVASRINVDTVIDLVHEDVVLDMDRLTLEKACPKGTTPSIGSRPQPCVFRIRGICSSVNVLSSVAEVERRPERLEVLK
jgi:uncharacterized membrane protein